MRKIDASNFDTLGISRLVFKYPLNSDMPKNNFYPDPDLNFERYMIIQENDDEVRLSSELIFLHENKNAILNLTREDLLDGTWWILPPKVRYS